MAMRDRITDPIVKVFVSSTWEDLQPERDAVEVALQRLHEPKYVGMEYFGSRDEDTRRASLDEVDRCQVYVGIFGGRYGSGITEAEYRRARDRGLPCLIYFKHEAHIPLKWRETDPEKAEWLARLKEELRQHHTISPPFTTPDDLAAKVTADLHRWLSGEFLAPQRDAYIKPWSVFERVHLVDRFVGREWLIAEVDTFLQDNDRGYFILAAKAGLGKTTFLAHLVKERGYIHHFVELAPGPDGIAPGLKNLATQLVRAWELALYSVDEVRPGTPVRPDFLQSLLFEAARRRDQVKPQEKIVLVVDALDEAGTPFGQNVLGLPKVLPRGVYFIVSQRPVEVRLVTEEPPLVFRLEATDEQNRADMRAYLERAARWEGVAKALRENSYSKEQFVDALREKCQGMWMYLHYVVEEIEQGKRSPLDLDTLPQGVWQYYAQYWQCWQKENSADWDTVHLPLLSTLAAVQEAVFLRHLCALAGVEEQPALRRLLEVAWSLFMVTEKGEEHRYRLYHASLREFLDGRADLTHMRNEEQALTSELADATRRAHGRIADHYLDAWGGLDSGLPGLRDEKQRDIDGRYGLRHLSAHLEAAGRVNDLHRLLRVEWRYQEEEQLRIPGWPGPLERLLGPPPVRVRTWYANAWYIAHEHAGDISGYFSDLVRAWRLAEQASDRQVRREELAASVGMEVRYALINASFNSLAANIPQSLLMALVTEQVFTPAQGLAYARQVPDPAQRAAALASLALCLSAPESTNALRSAVAAAHLIRDSGFQSEMLNYLAVQLAEAGYPGEALAAAQAIQDKEAQAKTLVRLAPQLAKLDYLDEVLSAVLKLPGGDSWRLGIRSKTLAELAACLTELGYLKDALVAVQAIENPEQQVEALAELAPHLTEGLVKTALLRTQSSSWLWQKARAVLIPRLAQLGHYEDALSRVRELSDSSVFDEYRARELTGLAPHLPKALLWDALAEAWRIKDEHQRATTVVGLAPYLTESQLRAALAAQKPPEQSHQAGGDLGSYWDHEEVDRSEALAALVPRLTELGYLEEALAAIREIEREAIRSETLKELGPSLPEPLLRQALEVARGIRNEGYQAGALASLVPRLAKLGYPEEALRTAQVLPEFALGHGNPRAAAFVALARHLPEHLWPELLPLVEGMQVVTARADALAGLAPYLPEPSLPKALALAKEIEWEGLRVKALVKLIPRGTVHAAKGRAVNSVDSWGMASCDCC